jgi:hypothetical protein
MFEHANNRLSLTRFPLLQNNKYPHNDQFGDADIIDLVKRDLPEHGRTEGHPT